MYLSPLAILIVWIPFGIWLFRRFPPRIATLVNFFAGWALLPSAPFPASDANFPYWILGVCLPTQFWLTKASVVGLAALAGTILFRSSDLRSFRPRLCDLPMAAWCAAPLFSAAAHPETLPMALFDTSYLLLSWAVPWVLGRLLFSNLEGLLLAAKACVLAGIAYIPICLIEFFAGPQFYAFLYGYQPYRWIGAERYVGFRPIGFLEDGNQLGIWMAASALVAAGLWSRQLAPRILSLPTGWVAAVLIAVTLLCQSAGSILLLILLLPLALLRQRAVLRTAVALLLLAIVALALARMSNRVSLRQLAQHSTFLHAIASRLSDLGRNSFAWRLARDEGHMALALRKPFFGYGEWNWWQGADARPWSLWLLVFGMYGLFGLAAFAGILFLPVVRTVAKPPDWPTPEAGNLRLIVASLILMVACDNLLNGAMILPYLLAMGGLAGGRAKLAAPPTG